MRRKIVVKDDFTEKDSFVTSSGLCRREIAKGEL